MTRYTPHLPRIFSKGFTLIETLVYVALFALLMSVAAATLYNLLEGGDRTRVAIGVQEEGTFINRKINWALTGASAVQVSPDGMTLTVTRPDLGTQSPLTVIADGATMTIVRNTGDPVVLNNERFLVERPAAGPLFSIQPASGGKPPSMTVNFRIQESPFIFKTYVRQ